MKCFCCKNRGMIGLKVTGNGTIDDKCILCGAYSSSHPSGYKEICTCGECHYSSCGCERNELPVIQSSFGTGGTTCECNNCSAGKIDIQRKYKKEQLKSDIIANYRDIRYNLNKLDNFDLPIELDIENEDKYSNQIIEYIQEQRNKFNLNKN